MPARARAGGVPERPGSWSRARRAGGVAGNGSLEVSIMAAYLRRSCGGSVVGVRRPRRTSSGNWRLPRTAIEVNISAAEIFQRPLQDLPTSVPPAHGPGDALG